MIDKLKLLDILQFTFLNHFLLKFAEAEYTYKLRKTFIPLRLEYKYNADGWLGIMIGTKLWFDFSVETKFEASLQGLIKEIHSMELSGGRCRIYPKTRTKYFAAVKDRKDKKVLLRERKRHTDRGVSSTPSVVLYRGSTPSLPGGTPIQPWRGVPHPALNWPGVPPPTSRGYPPPPTWPGGVPSVDRQTDG